MKAPMRSLFLLRELHKNSLIKDEEYEEKRRRLVDEIMRKGSSEWDRDRVQGFTPEMEGEVKRMIEDHATQMNSVIVDLQKDLNELRKRDWKKIQSSISEQISFSEERQNKLTVDLVQNHINVLEEQVKESLKPHISSLKTSQHAVDVMKAQLLEKYNHIDDYMGSIREYMDSTIKKIHQDQFEQKKRLTVATQEIAKALSDKLQQTKDNNHLELEQQKKEIEEAMASLTQVMEESKIYSQNIKSDILSFVNSNIKDDLMKSITRGDELVLKSASDIARQYMDMNTVKMTSEIQSIKEKVTKEVETFKMEKDKFKNEESNRFSQFEDKIEILTETIHNQQGTFSNNLDVMNVKLLESISLLEEQVCELRKQTAEELKRVDEFSKLQEESGEITKINLFNETSSIKKDLQSLSAEFSNSLTENLMKFTLVGHDITKSEEKIMKEIIALQTSINQHGGTLTNEVSRVEDELRHLAQQTSSKFDTNNAYFTEHLEKSEGRNSACINNLEKKILEEVERTFSNSKALISESRENTNKEFKTIKDIVGTQKHDLGSSIQIIESSLSEMKAGLERFNMELRSDLSKVEKQTEKQVDQLKSDVKGLLDDRFESMQTHQNQHESKQQHEGEWARNTFESITNQISDVITKIEDLDRNKQSKHESHHQLLEIDAKIQLSSVSLENKIKHMQDELKDNPPEQDLECLNHLRDKMILLENELVDLKAHSDKKTTEERAMTDRLIQSLEHFSQSTNDQLHAVDHKIEDLSRTTKEEIDHIKEMIAIIPKGTEPVASVTNVEKYNQLGDKLVLLENELMDLKAHSEWARITFDSITNQISDVITKIDDKQTTEERAVTDNLIQSLEHFSQSTNDQLHAVDHKIEDLSRTTKEEIDHIKEMIATIPKETESVASVTNVEKFDPMVQTMSLTNTDIQNIESKMSDIHSIINELNDSMQIAKQESLDSLQTMEDSFKNEFKNLYKTMVSTDANLDVLKEENISLLSNLEACKGDILSLFILSSESVGKSTMKEDVKVYCKEYLESVEKKIRTNETDIAVLESKHYTAIENIKSKLGELLTPHSIQVKMMELEAVVQGHHSVHYEITKDIYEKIAKCQRSTDAFKDQFSTALQQSGREIELILKQLEIVETNKLATLKGVAFKLGQKLN